ncbi:gp53-like domain-containing protein [Paraburkholderia tropica]|uniref:gp53-like domain-containing protein n=1 Tax=Paraburkholderia tropica TaxID=92647 RepID=UPI002AB76F52|nr:hypothetical protein [Paraburkholderia tropica]
MSFASNLAALARLLTAAASGIVSGKAPAAGDSSTALINSAWFKAEQAAEATQGTAKVATQAQTVAGTDDTTIVTPKKLRAGFSISIGPNGYLAFPTWLGGLIVQWGYVQSTGAVGSYAVTTPIAFPNSMLQAAISNAASTSPTAQTLAAANWTKTGFTAFTSTGATTWSFSWISIGY